MHTNIYICSYTYTYMFKYIDATKGSSRDHVAQVICIYVFTYTYKHLHVRIYI